MKQKNHYHHNNKPNNWMLYIIIALFAVLAALYLYTHYEIEEYEKIKKTPASIEVQKNPFLASQIFLENQNNTIAPKDDYPDITTINTSDILFITSADKFFYSRERIHAALNWIHSGGRMIVGNAYSNFETDQSLLDYFSVEIGVLYDKPEQLLEDDKSDINKNNQNNNDNSQHKEDTRTDLLKFAEGPDLEINSDSLTTLKHKFITDQEDLEIKESTYQKLDNILKKPKLRINKPIDRISSLYSINNYAAINNRLVLLKIGYGKGELTVWPNIHLFTNRHIEKADHAWLLATLIPENSNVHYFYDINHPSLLSIFKLYFPEMLFAFISFLLLWLWHNAKRTSHLRIASQKTHRQFDQHLLASAKFLTLNKQYTTLINPIKDDIHQQMKTLHPSFNQLNDEERAKILSKYTNIDSLQIMNWYKNIKSINSRDQFMQALKFGHTIRKQL